MRNLEEFGIDIGLLISGLFGAILMLSKSATDSIKTTVLAIVGGAASANYLTPVIMDVTGIKMPKAQFSIAFLMGYLGLKGVELISNKVIEQPVRKNKLRR
jgi:hypothetical protein